MTKRLAFGDDHGAVGADPKDVAGSVKALLTASGYGFDIAEVRRLELNPDSAGEYRWALVYEMHIFQGAEHGIPPHCDADSYESARRGEVCRSGVTGQDCKTWLYGHSGFDVLHVDSVGIGPGKKYPKSEDECFWLFREDLFSGYLNKVLPMLPKVGSDEEMRLWLATVGK